jgi:drug/metabolite transporter (DMT)-like permease
VSDTAQPVRRRLLEAGSGSRTEAFGAQEWLLLASIALIWGSSFLFIDIGLEAFRPGVVALARVALGVSALALFPAARRPVDRQDLPRVAFLGVIWAGLPLVLFPLAQQWIDSSVAGMLNGAVPLFGAAWAVLLLRRPLGRTQTLGLLVGFAGVVAISWPEVQGSRATTLGAALVLLAVMLYGLAVNLAVPLQQRYGALPVLLRAQLTALVLLAPFGLWSLPGSRFAWGSALAMLPLGILGTGLAFVLMTTLVGRVGGPRGAVATYFIPVVAIALGVAFLGERVAPLALLGTALVLGGAWLTSRRDAAAARSGAGG